MNSRFFHKTATTCRETNKIKTLRDVSGNTFDHINALCRVAKDYFEGLYAQSIANCDQVISKVNTVVSVSDNNDLLGPFQIDEVKEAIHHVNGDQSPGPEGYNPAFFHKF